MKNKRNIKKKKLKKALVIGGISVAITSSIVAVKGFSQRPEIENQSYSSESSMRKAEEIPSNVYTDTKEDLHEETKKSAPKFVLKNYNNLGNNLERQDLGCAIETSVYLFKDKNTCEYFYDTLMENVPSNLECVDGENMVYVYVDKTNDSRPIAGITEIEGEIVNVKINAYTSKNLGVIKCDENKYINFNSSSDEMNDYFESTKEYYEERLAIVQSKR